MSKRKYKRLMAMYIAIIIASAIVIIGCAVTVIQQIPVITNGVAESMGYEKPGQTAAPIEIVEPTPTPVPVTETAKPYTADELEALAIVIYQEAGGDACSDETRQMVGEVVLNRVASPRYPDTIHEVATQKSQYGRLYWTGLVWPKRASSPYETHAVNRAYAIAENLLRGNVERLLPLDTIYQAEFVQGTEVVCHQDGTYFCR